MVELFIRAEFLDSKSSYSLAQRRPRANNPSASCGQKYSRDNSAAPQTMGKGAQGSTPADVKAPITQKGPATLFIHGVAYDVTDFIKR